jgi:opacity protein-like surface antigen
VTAIVAMAAVLLAGEAAVAQDVGKPFALTVYLQQAFPKQTNTNKQIEQINQQFGVDFDTWDDIVNLSLGLQFLTKVSPYWQVGAEWDYSRGGIEGSATVPTEAGPASLEFSQKYSIYADFLAVAHFLPCPGCKRWQPFVLLGAGFGYESDRTKLSLRNDSVDQWLQVDNDGYFPVWTLGVGADVDLTRSGSVYFQLGVAYYWGRLDHYVPAEGPLAPAPEVRADNDTTGPNYWLGVGWRF